MKLPLRFFVEAEIGSREKGLFDEATLEKKGVRTTVEPYPYPYGFIMDTKTEDGDALDCYLISKVFTRQTSIVECEPIGLLEFFEEEEIDHKVLAVPVGETVAADEELRSELETFLLAIFAAHPEMTVRVGRLLSKQAAGEYVTACSILSN